MERKLSLPIYVTAFLLSVAIFAIGIYIGTLLDGANFSRLSDDVDEISQRSASLQLLFLLEGNSSSFCPVFRSELASIDQDVERVGYELTYLEQEREAYDPEFKRQYFNLEAGSYLLSKRINEVCGGDDILLLYFYSNKQCNGCKEQGEEILRFRDTLDNVHLKIYSFDGDIDSPIAEALMDQYGVTEYPSVVVNGMVHSGYADSNALSELVSNE